MGDKTQGGGVKKNCSTKTKTIGGRVKGAKIGSKRLNHVRLNVDIDKPTRYVGLG